MREAAALASSKFYLHIYRACSPDLRWARAFLWLLALKLLLCGTPMLGAPHSDRPFNPGLIAARWPAFWITSPESSTEVAGVYYFRREFNMASVPAHFWVHVSADNRFILHLNGKYVAEGPARGDLFHWRFETIDLAPQLVSGKNIISAVVWNFGEQSPVAQMSSRTGFLVQGDTEAEAAINTGAEWRARKEKGRSAIGHNGVRGYYAAGPAERIDGRLLDWDWDRAEANLTEWEAPRMLGHASTREAQDAPNAWELVQDELPPMEHRDVEAGSVVRAEGIQPLPTFPQEPLKIPSNSHITLLLDRHELQTAYPELVVSGGKDADIHLTYSEALYDAQGKKGNRDVIDGRHIEGVTDQFIADGGEDRIFQPLWWRTWRFLQIDVTTKDQALQLQSLRAWFTAYPFDAKATIDADIPQLDRLWQTGWRTARLNAHETYMDAPYWEQLQYVGDTRIQALISYVVAGDPRLARQAISNIDDSRTPEGITESRYPSGLPQFIPPFSLLWVNMLHDYWMYVDDLPFVIETLPHTRTVIDWYASHLRPDGLLGKMNWWQFADWTATYKYGVPPQDSDGGSTFLTLQFIGALQAAAEMESQYGSQERVREYQEIIRKASDALIKQNWDDAHGLFADTPAKNSWSQDANILSVISDVAPRAQQQQILKRLLGSKRDESAMIDGISVPPLSEPSYYFRFYLSRALEHAGMGDSYVGQLQPWYDMLNLGLTTWAETPEPTRSDSHAWSASPNYDLLTIVAGIEPSAPGFKKVRITPHLEGLHLEASMPSPQGTIRVTYRKGGDQWSATLTLPDDLDGEFVWKDKKWALHSGTQTLALSN
jgi:alpha-L-rhamnosidase